MAGQWIKFDVGTPDKPEVWAMATELDLDPDAVVGKLLRVWAWFDDQTKDGNAPSVTCGLLDRRVGVTGFCQSMVNVGWMVMEGDEVLLPNFERHNGETAKKRALTQKRVSKHRGKGNAGGVTQNVTPSVTEALPEKRREEKKEDIGVGARGRVYPPEDFQAAAATHQRIAADFPGIDMQRLVEHFKSIEFNEPGDWNRRLYSFAADNGAKHVPKASRETTAQHSRNTQTTIAAAQRFAGGPNG